MKPRSFWQFYVVPVSVMVLAYILPMAAATLAVRAGDPQALKARQALLERVKAAGPIAAAARQLRAGRYVRATLTVFLWNLGVGALAMSTLVGGLFFVMPPLVAAGRGVMLGLLYDPGTFEGARGIVAVGTAVLELPTYIIAGALGMRLGLAWLLPPRRERLREVWEHARWSLPAVALILLLAAAWEVGGIVLVGARP
ncbi:MAG TPA: stage II sporulation protein M [Candidatus Methylomirabilis sp.]